MPHTRATPLIGLLVVLAVTGCSTVVAGQAAPVPGSAPSASAAPGTGGEPAAADGVAWADQVCGTFLTTNLVLRDQPTADLANPAATLDGYAQYFGRSVPALEAAVTQFSALGAGPLDGGDRLIAGMIGLVTLMRDAHHNAQTAVAAIDPASPTIMSQELPAALALTDVQDAAPQIDIAATPELNAAAEAAPNCRAIAG